MRNAKSGRNIKKHTHFSSHTGWVKKSYFVGWQMLRFLGPEFIPNHRKCLLGKDAIFGGLVGGLSGIWPVCRWFVESLWVVWLVCRWFVGGFKFYS